MAAARVGSLVSKMRQNILKSRIAFENFGRRNHSERNVDVASSILQSSDWTISCQSKSKSYSYLSAPNSVCTPCPRDLIRGALAACAGMTLQNSFDSLKNSKLFEGTIVRSWEIRVEEHFSGSNIRSFDVPAYFSLEIKVNAEPSFTLSQRDRLERVLLYCPVKNSLKQDVRVRFID